MAVEEAAKEAKLIEQFLAKCAEDDRRELVARRARDEARARYMAEIAAQRDERVALYQAQKLAELEAVEEAKRADEFRKRVVEEARRKMLQEHAAALVRCLVICCLSHCQYAYTQQPHIHTLHRTAAWLPAAWRHPV